MKGRYLSFVNIEFLIICTFQRMQEVLMQISTIRINEYLKGMDCFNYNILYMLRCDAIRVPT